MDLLGQRSQVRRAAHALEEALNWSTTPQTRLRAASFGRLRRDDKAEDGRTNAVEAILPIVLASLDRSGPPRKKNSFAGPSKRNPINQSIHFTSPNKPFLSSLR